MKQRGKRYTNKQKLLLIITAFFIGTIFYLLAFSYNYNQLTAWQKQQDINFSAQTGSSKFQAHVYGLIYGGVGFVISAYGLILFNKFYLEKK